MKTTIYHHLLVLSSLVWIGSHRAVASETPLCGLPPINKRKDKGVFLTKKCGFSDQWFVQATGGRQTLSVNGTLMPEENARVVVKNKDFTIDVDKKDVDGFTFRLKKGEACFTLNSPDDAPLYVGKNRVQLSSKSVRLPSFKPCDGPVLEYLFDTSNNVYKDSGEKGFDGKAGRGRYVGSHSPGFAGRSVYLDGRDDTMIIPDSTKMNMNEYTMMAWVWYRDTGSKDFAYQIIQKSSAIWLNINVETRAVNGGGFFGGCGGKDLFKVTSTKPVPKEHWTHVAVTNDRNSLKIYINGDLSGEATLPTSKPHCANLGPFVIGSNYRETASESKGYFGGYMDSVRVFDKDLSQEEVRSEMFRN